jgi:two-component system nitrate/nitrite response regulator NarL
MVLRVLIVDDHAAFRSWAARLLAAGGLEVVGEAATGERGLAAARALRPDVVLLDVQLPDADGFEVCRSLGELGFRVVLCSVRDARDYGDRVAGSTAAGFVPKERLSAAELRRLLGREAGAE